MAMKTKAIALSVAIFYGAGLILAQENPIIFKQDYNPNGSAYPSAYDPGIALDFETAENFFQLGNAIGKVAFYGLTAIQTADGFIEQTPADKEPFIIRFYEFKQTPSKEILEPEWENPVSTHHLMADVIHIGPIFDNRFQLYKMELTLDEAVVMSEGWVSAQIDVAHGSGTWFYWLNSLEGDGQSWIRGPTGKTQADIFLPDASSTSIKKTKGSKNMQLDYDVSLELFMWVPAFEYDITIFQLSYDWGASLSVENSRVGLIQCDYMPDDDPMFLNAYVVTVDGEIYWICQLYLPSAGHSSGMQSVAISFDLEPLGIQDGDVLEHVSVEALVTSEPLTSIPQWPSTDNWPVVTVKQMIDSTLGGVLISMAEGVGVTIDWPFVPDQNIWNESVTELVYRGNEMPNIDLDHTNHPHNPETNYAGDWNACVPAGFANSIKWLESIYKDSVPSLNTNQTHREVLEDLSGKMNREPDEGVCIQNHLTAGKMKYAQKHRLPIITKLQMDSTFIRKGVDVRPEGTSYAAENQTGKSGKPDWAWLVNELKNGEDVEITAGWWNQDSSRWDGAHTMVVTGILEVDTLLRAIWFADDRDQNKTDDDAVLQEFSFVLEIDDWLVLTGLSRPGRTAKVLNLVSESYDPTKTYERISGTLADKDGNAIDPDKLGIEARLWNNPEDGLSLSDGSIEYQVIDGLAFFDIDYDSFENPPQPGDRIEITFRDGETFITHEVYVPEDRGPVFIEVVVYERMKSLMFTEWHQVSVPPGWKLTTTFLYTPAPGCNGNADAFVWNGTDWVIPPWGHWNNNPPGTTKQVFNRTDGPGIIRLHHADEANPGLFLFNLSPIDGKDETSPGNQHEHANVNLGGRDYFNVEFGHIQATSYHYTYEIGALLGEFPGTIGAGGVQELHFYFESFDNVFWSDMKLTIDLINVVGEGYLHIAGVDKDASATRVLITPGQEVVTARLGGFTPPGMHSLVLTVDASLQFDVDCFNMSSWVVLADPEAFIHVQGDGSVSVEPAEGPYIYGDTLTLTAMPGTGHRFVQWEGHFTRPGKNNAAASEDNPIEIIIEADTRITAIFALQVHTITALPNHEDYGGVSGGGEYEHFSMVELLATPAQAYHFVNWTEEGQVVMDGDDPAPEAYSFMAETDRNLVGNFALTTFTVSFIIEDQQGEAITHAVVTLDQVQNPAGNYVFEHVEPGNYSYRVTAAHYREASGGLEVIDQDLALTVVLEVDDTGMPGLHPAGISIYPNPARNILYVEAGIMISQIHLLDILGQRVLSEAVNDIRHEVSLSGLKDGLYFIQVFTGRGVKTLRLQIVR